MKRRRSDPHHRLEPKQLVLGGMFLNANLRGPVFCLVATLHLGLNGHRTLALADVRRLATRSRLVQLALS